MKNTQERAPSVIIGVGGIGSDICASVERMMPANAPDKDKVRFVVIDTDVNSIRDLQRKGFRGTAITLTDNMTVGTCRTLMEEYVKDWYPASKVFDRKSMTEGAGQQRAISRLALEYAALEGKLSPLYSVIQQLEEIDPSNEKEQPITFYIISSLAGGTGSGISLPLAMYINDYVGSKHFEAFSGCKGFFMLSSALEEGVDSTLEQQSLDANAYAALKELSGFMRVADGDDERYGQLKMSLAGRSRQGDQSVQPHSYEYCFLFGLRNKKNVKVHSFSDLKDIIANAVYMQACSPMHSRNSSREDNKLHHNTVLKNQQGEKHLRRFGAIGCGELCFPKDLLREYYAMCWAKEVMRDQWRKYDLVYQEREREELEKKQRGLRWVSVDRGVEYVHAILAADDQDTLAADIKDACSLPTGDTWNAYLDAMWDEIGRRVDAEKGTGIRDLASPVSKAHRYLAYATQNLTRRQLVETANDIIDWVPRAEDSVMSFGTQYASVLGNTWFAPYPSLDNLPDYCMEYWLIKHGDFIHPNAVRYFLYQLKKAIEVRREKAQKDCEELKSRFMDSRNVQKFKDCGPLPFPRREKMLNCQQEYRESLESHYNYAKNEIFDHVLEKCGRYVNKLILEYEKFYDSYQQLLQEFDVNILSIEEELDRKNGLSKVYVCADRECREKVTAEMKQQREFAHVDGALSHYLFQYVGSGRWGQMDAQHRFMSIKNYWSDGLEPNFPKLLSPHILHAIDMEEFYKYGRHMDEKEMKARIAQVKENMTLPFLQFRRLGSTKQGISIYCYNSTLNQEQGVFQEVVRWLKGEESVDDLYYCSPHRMVFYYSFFGLDVPELLEYMHGQVNAPYAMGSAFYAYEEMVEDMGRSMSQEVTITPHTDKKWHNLQHMPDPQMDYQNNKEYRIGEALLYAFLSGRIDRNEDYASEYVFTIGDTHFKARRLIDCHDILYDNQFIVAELLRGLRVEIDRLELDREAITGAWESSGKNLWDMFFRYANELTRREYSGQWKKYLLHSYERFAMDCIGNGEAPDQAKELLRNQLELFIAGSKESNPEEPNPDKAGAERKLVDKNLLWEVRKWCGLEETQT